MSYSSYSWMVGGGAHRGAPPPTPCSSGVQDVLSCRAGIDSASQMESRLVGHSQLLWQYWLHSWERKKAAMPDRPRSVSPYVSTFRLCSAGSVRNRPLQCTAKLSQGAGSLHWYPPCRSHSRHCRLVVW